MLFVLPELSAQLVNTDDSPMSQTKHLKQESHVARWAHFSELLKSQGCKCIKIEVTCMLFCNVLTKWMSQCFFKQKKTVVTRSILQIALARCHATNRIYRLWSHQWCSIDSIARLTYQCCLLLGKKECLFFVEASVHALVCVSQLHHKCNINFPSINLCKGHKPAKHPVTLIPVNRCIAPMQEKNNPKVLIRP